MIEKRELESLQARLSMVYGLKSGIAVENTSIGVIYIHRDPQRKDADIAISQASAYIKGKCPKVNVIVYDEK